MREKSIHHTRACCTVQAENTESSEFLGFLHDHCDLCGEKAFKKQSIK